MSDNQNAQKDEDSPLSDKQRARSTTDSNRPIWPRRRGRKRRRKTCLNFGKIYEIFPGMNTEVLCQLSEVSELLPSKVRDLVTGAAAVQIAAFMNLAEEARQQRKKRGGQHQSHSKDAYVRSRGSHSHQ